MTLGIRRPVVLHVLEAYAGGTERHLNDLVQFASGCEHVLAVPTLHHRRSTARAARAARAASARVVPVEMGRGRDAHRNLTATWALRSLIRRVRPDVIHAHSSIGGVVARLATLSMPTPLVYTPHGVSRAPWALSIERSLRDRVDRFIAVSASEAAFAIRQGLADPDRVVVIPNGIELEGVDVVKSCRLRERIGIARDVPLVGCIGRLTWQKAPEVYVAACARVHAHRPDAHFVLIGSGELQEPVERAIADADLTDRFHLLPYLENASACMHELDLYVLPSRFEGGPYTPLEAMRARTPVIVTDTDGNRDAVNHRVTGLVVPCDDAVALGDAIRQILADPELARTYAQAGWDALTRFDVRAMAARTEAVYTDLPSSRPIRLRAPVLAGAIGQRAARARLSRRTTRRGRLGVWPLPS